MELYFIEEIGVVRRVYIYIKTIFAYILMSLTFNHVVHLNPLHSHLVKEVIFLQVREKSVGAQHRFHTPPVFEDIFMLSGLGIVFSKKRQLANKFFCHTLILCLTFYKAL